LRFLLLLEEVLVVTIIMRVVAALVELFMIQPMQ
jgi:hypothetical protein